jgi:hypothetical protein
MINPRYELAGADWQDNNLVFCHEDGRQYTRDALNWRFSKVTKRAGIGHWHAHEGRHTAVSIMSHNGVPIQDIADAVGPQVHPRHRDRLPARDRASDPGRRDRHGYRVRQPRQRYRQRKRAHPRIQVRVGTWLGT